MFETFEFLVKFAALTLFGCEQLTQGANLSVKALDLLLELTDATDRWWLVPIWTRQVVEPRVIAQVVVDLDVGDLGRLELLWLVAH
jgi:hypothetical protein